jgi:hypothetical protein
VHERKLHQQRRVGKQCSATGERATPEPHAKAEADGHQGDRSREASVA